MKLKGMIKTIEAIDKDGNSKVILVNEHNLVTNAYQDIFVQNFMADAMTPTTNEILNHYTPISSLFNGLLLFKNDIRESDENILPSAEDFEGFVGCVGGFYDGSDVYRGSLNSDLTLIKNDEMDLVFDFGMDKINDKIKTICLTSRAGGVSGLNKTNDTSVVSSFLSAYKKDNVRSGECVAGCGTMQGDGVCSANYFPLCKKDIDGTLIGANNNGVLFTAQIVDGQIVLRAFKYLVSLGFTDEVVTIANPDEYESKCGSKLENTGLFKKMCESLLETGIEDSSQLFVKNNKIFACEETTAGSYKITTYTYEEDQFTSISYEYTTNCNVNLNGIKTNGEKVFGTYSNGTTYYLYVVNLSNAEYKRIEIVDSNLKIIQYRDTIMLADTSATSGEETRTYYVYSSGGNLCPITIRFNNVSDSPIYGFIDCFSGPVIGTLSEYGGYTTINMNVVTPYKATINNLTTSITKGTTNTFRVTYNIKCVS